MSSSFGDIVAEETVFFMCDMQVKFVPVMQHFDDIITVTERLVRLKNMEDFSNLILALFS